MSEILHLVARLKSALESIDWLGREERPKLRPPATADELQAFEKQLGRKIPPTYREFLRMHNGMEGMEQYDWGIAGTTESEVGESFDDVRAGHLYVYKAQDARHPALKELKDSFVLASDFDAQVVYFAPQTMKESEPAIRRIASDQPFDEFPDFENFGVFLEFITTIYEDLLDLQNESFSGEEEEDGGGEDQLLRELANLLRQEDKRSAPAEEKGPPVKLSPEMELASKLCRRTLELLVQNELIELVEGMGMMDSLEDLMLRKLLRSKSQPETIKNWIDSLSKAREVEELYGTDEELTKIMNRAFAEFSP